MKNTKRVVRAARKANKLPVWLDRTTNVNPYCLTLCTTPEMFLAEQRRMKVKPHEVREYPKKGAQISWFESDDYDDPTIHPAIIITIALGDPTLTAIQIAAMLAHEAVHVAQRVMERIGEKNPSDEFFAYTVQATVQNLMIEFVRQMEAAA